MSELKELKWRYVDGSFEEDGNPRVICDYMGGTAYICEMNQLTVTPNHSFYRSINETDELGHLIASAPEMLETLLAVSEFMSVEYACAKSQALNGEYVSSEVLTIWNKIHEVIAKAEMKSS